jgi:predicted MFS family arabinose efflux permease
LTAKLDRKIVLLLATTAGAAAANLYYAQPLLGSIGRDLDVSEGAAGILVTCAQFGYVAGLCLVVPLGDLLERRRLLCTVSLLAAASAAGCAAAPTFAVLAVVTAALGVTASVAQVAVPLAASLAGEEERGSVVGFVMSGLFVGILSARVLSGLIGGASSWRVAYVFAAVLMALLALLLRAALPPSRAPADELTYGGLLRSVLSLIREEPVLRERMAVGATLMGGFSVFWTSAAFLLGGHYGYGDATIGLFGIAGVAGALAAPLAGRVADRGEGRRALLAFLGVVLASWALLAAGGTAIVLLVLGILALDFGIQGAQISNQSAIYALRPEARSRLTTAYIVSIFLGGAAGSALSALVWSSGGWGAVCGLGAGVAAVGLAGAAVALRRRVHDPV